MSLALEQREYDGRPSLLSVGPDWAAPSPVSASGDDQKKILHMTALKFKMATWSRHGRIFRAITSSKPLHCSVRFGGVVDLSSVF